jgi:phosphonate transport system ATP-binding protein
VLRIQNLNKIYPNGTHALRDLSFEVESGEFLVIIGLSGSGKSTLLRCINRLIEPTSGRIELDGVDVTAASPAELRRIRSQVGMVFQHFNLVRRASVLSNVLAGALGRTPAWQSAFYQFPRAEIDRALANLERVGIREKARQRADTLSGGQQQRVGIARALMQAGGAEGTSWQRAPGSPEPEQPLSSPRPTAAGRLMLADEPVASLDPATSHSVLRYLEQVNQEEGITVLCNLHFLSLARRYASRVVALKAGQIVFDGAPTAITPDWFRQIYGEDAVEVEIN